MDYDVIIIGAGTAGMSAGYYLSERGQKVALIDAYDPPHSEGAHHGDTRIIRHAYGEGANYVSMALRASELWADLEEKANRKIFYNTGVLNIGTRDSDFLNNVIHTAEEFSLPVKIFSASEVNAKWRGFQLDDHLLGCFESGSGVLLSEEAIRAYRELALHHGATLYWNTMAEKIEVTEANVKVSFNGEHITGKNLLITTGKGTNKVLSLLDVELPLTPTRKTFSWFDSSEDLYHPGVFPAWSYDDGKQTLYGFPSIEQAGLKIGRHDGGIPVNPENELEGFGTHPEDKNDVMNFVNKHFSEPGNHKSGKVCTYTNSPDGDFIIDRLPRYSNIVVASGFSGHGFKFGSVFGEILSQMIVDGSPELDISSFSLARF
ncbi:N-methyl-L-tryptophan oxidase [Virgibacillus oceani]